jgi:hypothetical protein
MGWKVWLSKTSGRAGRRRPAGGSAAEPGAAGPRKEGVRAVSGVLIALGVFALAGLAALTATALGEGRLAWSVIGVGLLVELAGIAVGALLGFLFAIPRSTPSRVVDDGAPTGAGLTVNANLVEISDWLTKILVGVGLIELGQLSTGYQGLVRGVSDDLGQGRGVASGVGALLLFSLAVGFMSGYLVTRTSLTLALQEYGDLASRVDKNARNISDQQKKLQQLDRDQRAINAVEALLGGASRSSGTGTAVNDLALDGVSREALARIFGRARRVRRGSTPGPATREERLSGVAAVFRALIAADTEKQHHRNFGQLGYALKDRTPPDYAHALEAFDEAIRIRDSQADRDYRMYEFSRAICKAALDPARGNGASTDAYRDSVVHDLTAGAADERVRNDDFALIANDPILGEFMERNGITRANAPWRDGAV